MKKYLFLLFLVSVLLLCLSACTVIMAPAGDLPCDHEYAEWTTIKSPSCTEGGLEASTCTLCEKTETRIMKKIPHAEVIDQAVAPDCTNEGLTEGSHCSVCGEVFVAQNVIPVINHADSNYDGFCDSCPLKLYSVGLTYQLSEDETYYSVTGIGTCQDTDVVIPSTYQGFPVKKIGKSAFRNCSSLVSITIPDSITNIDIQAFSYCTSLINITIPDSVTSIGSFVFGYCSSLESVTIPDSVTSIGSMAFSGCPNLQYNAYDNAYYLGNSQNPYLVLVKVKALPFPLAIFTKTQKRFIIVHSPVALLL